MSTTAKRKRPRFEWRINHERTPILNLALVQLIIVRARRGPTKIDCVLQRRRNNNVGSCFRRRSWHLLAHVDRTRAAWDPETA